MDFILLPLLLLFGYRLAKKEKFKSQLLRKIAVLLYYYHMGFSLIFSTYVYNLGGDAILYWGIPKKITFSQLLLDVQTTNIPSNYMYLINYIPSNILDLSFFTGGLIYGILGYIGILYLLKIIDEIFPYFDSLKNYKILSFKIFPYIFFLPNFHFWSAGIGKDTLSFFCVCIFSYAIIRPLKNWFLLFIAITITYLIRPHITLLLIGAYAGSIILLSKIPKYQKILIIMILLISFLPLLNYVLEFANIDEANVDSFNKFSEHKAGSLSRSATTGVDLSALPYPLKVLTFLYRPFFFDVNNILGLLASLENLVWLILSIIFFTHKPFKLLKKSNFMIIGSFLFWLVGALAFAPVMSNLGIIVRERNMFLPAFIIFFIGSLSHSRRYYNYSILYKRYIRKKRYEQMSLKDNIKF